MKKQILLAVLLLQNLTSFSQKNDTNYDETKVGTYTLPDPFSGKLLSRKEWEKQRKTWINLFGENMYGNTPKNKAKLRFELLETKTDLTLLSASSCTHLLVIGISISVEMH